MSWLVVLTHPEAPGRAGRSKRSSSFESDPLGCWKAPPGRDFTLARLGSAPAAGTGDGCQESGSRDLGAAAAPTRPAERARDEVQFGGVSPTRRAELAAAAVLPSARLDRVQPVQAARDGEEGRRSRLALRAKWAAPGPSRPARWPGRDRVNSSLMAGDERAAAPVGCVVQGGV